MILLLGVNHKTAPLAVREKIFAGCQEEINLLPELLAVDGVQEILYLSTCNRIELVASIAGAKRHRSCAQSSAASLISDGKTRADRNGYRRKSCFGKLCRGRTRQKNIRLA